MTAFDISDESDCHTELKELELRNLEAMEEPRKVNDEPKIVTDTEPDFARFALVKADITGRDTDKYADDAGPTLLLTLARM